MDHLNGTNFLNRSMTAKTDTSLPSPKPLPGKLIILAAPSGAGKTTLAKKLLVDFPEIIFSVSATTRTPRNQEIHGADYLFLSPEEFQRHIDRDNFLEWEEFYQGIRYGTLRTEVEKLRKKGYFVLLDVDVKGALNVKKQYGPEALSIFIKPPSDNELIRRLKNRGTENEQSLALRIERARMEMSFAGRFDCQLVNDHLEHCYGELKTLVRRYIQESAQPRV